MLKKTINHLLEIKTKIQSKAFENLNIVGIIPVITEHPNSSHKLCKTVRQAEKVGFNSSLYSDLKK